MAVITFPAGLVPDTFEFGVQYNTQVSTTELSGIMQTVELPGARWKGSMSFRDMTPSESATLKGFLLELRGAANSFYYGDISHDTPFGGFSGTTTIGAGSTRRILNIGKLDQTKYLLPGSSKFHIK